MKTHFTTKKPDQTGSALILVIIMSATALLTLGYVMTYSSNSAQLTHRSIQYTRSVAAAEAATERVISRMTEDFQDGGESLVINNLNAYRQNTVPTSADSSYWSTWEFNDAIGNIGRTYVNHATTNYVVLDTIYAGLQGYVSTNTVVSHARDTANPQNVMGGVLQQLQLVSIPIFQFGMYSSGNMEISCGQNFIVTGRVHSNAHLYVEPDSTLTFNSGVTAVFDILFQRDTADGDTTRGNPAGSVVYTHPDEKISPMAALTLPIGTANTPQAIREIIEPPPPGEDPNSATGRLRYYNESQMLLFVTSSNITATSPYMSSNIPPIQLAQFVKTNASFVDNRESKTVRPIDINIGNLNTWANNNTNPLRVALAARSVPNNGMMSSIYIVDDRNLPATSLGAVRVLNGKQLPLNGLTVSTGRPLYVQGDYNQPGSLAPGNTNTILTAPASLAADAITILSDNWADNSPNDASALNTTVNAAILTGAVPTTVGQYSGGMENFPRFLEDWSSATFTYNGSMINMFPSQYAIGFWNGLRMAVIYYHPPKRDWAYDANFDNPAKLPPLTPELQEHIRGQWVPVAPGATNAVATIP
jgi:hypothetical protein